MADIQVRFQCGCVNTVDVDKVASPKCLTHHQRATGVVKAPPPRFTGHVSGPNTIQRHLEPIAVQVASKPLPALKDPLNDEAA